MFFTVVCPLVIHLEILLPELHGAITGHMGSSCVQNLKLKLGIFYNFCHDFAHTRSAVTDIFLNSGLSSTQLKQMK